ncbi:DEAD-box RNA helicase PRP5 NDAI_0F02010 [Naumovozyma dairenensis CBS 421]|uniref:RNA helicase n=1 Tax=Naumovozyma dairenensis (strain ATCC 10597 / BCRC 20456 / CBS 421 / NBRC 0211 / NRRL Y-12639) TaxID=1071378 RepID=G0WCK8_NAUDC|nr:hypothetical protein NDAI_0F02010 [Naumovozyma dairenensis CBS 421]CCD25519.1 hypothetical protein NDAI_0F02010 [Naumovozyma dairenensis CBS 421]
MDSVSLKDSTSTPSNTKDAVDKQRLLQERRAKLAKWKQKKIEQDLQKKSNNVTNNDANIRIRSEPVNVRDKNDEALPITAAKRIIEDVDTIPPKKESKKQKQVERKRKKKKQGQIPFTFFGDPVVYNLTGTKVDEQITTPPQIFRPGTKEIPSIETRKNEDVAIDPLEQFMDSLNANVEPRVIMNNNAGDVMDEDDDQTKLSDEQATLADDKNLEENARYAKITKRKTKKFVSEIQYNAAELEPFQKQFYVEPEEIKQMSSAEVEELRLNLDNIKVKGHDCPKPITKWSQLGLNTDVMDLITKDFGFRSLTPIQSQAIPAIMDGHDVIGISKTGSGKTISYLLPLIRHIKAQNPLMKNETGPLGLILAPTRELALQIHQEIIKFISTDTAITSICCTGGSELKQQINSLKKGVHIVVATPGRLIDLLTLNNGRLMSIKRVTFVIMDEADRLFDLGFEPQITQIMKTIRPDKQCVLFSATFPNKLRNFAMRILRDPLSITINSQSLVNERVQQRFHICANDEEKFDELLAMIEENSSEPIETTDLGKEEEEEHTPQDRKTIIFVASQQICDFIGTKLENEGYQPFSIHAGKSYQERVQNLENFKSTKNSILVATEVLSRGLNITEVSLVIIFNAVKTFAQYVHTTGRTARGNHSGVAISLILPNELNAAYIIRKAIRDNELNSHASDQITKLNEMAKDFEKGMNSGKFRLSKGFGGKGLDNLDSKREEQHIEEKRKYDTTPDLGTKGDKRNNVDKNSTTSVFVDKSTALDLTQVPKLDYKFLQDKTLDGSLTVSAKVNVNDLPQLVRWEVTKNTTLLKVKNETGCSITNKGRYYPPGQDPQNENEEPKLYLLIEGRNEKDVRLGIELLEEKVKDGVKKVEYQAIKSNKY